MTNSKVNKAIVVLRFIAWLGVFVGLIVVMGFVNHQQKQQKCTDISIRISGQEEAYFIKENEIRSMLFDTYGHLIGENAGDIALTQIETDVEKLNGVKEAEAYMDLRGVLSVDINQKIPVARLFFNDGTSGYLDQEGQWMQWSNNFTPRVIVVSGNLPDLKSIKSEGKAAQKGNKVNWPDLLELIETINNDDFLNAQFEQIYIDNKQDIRLIPRVGRHEINLGKATDLTLKFEKLRLFYDEGISHVDWNRYKTIDLRFKDQVVCTKR